MDTFGDAGSVTVLPESDPRRDSMRATILHEDWPDCDRLLYAPVSVGELRSYGTGPTNTNPCLSRWWESNFPLLTPTLGK